MVMDEANRGIGIVAMVNGALVATGTARPSDGAETGNERFGKNCFIALVGPRRKKKGWGNRPASFRRPGRLAKRDIAMTRQKGVDFAVR